MKTKAKRRRKQSKPVVVGAYERLLGKCPLASFYDAQLDPVKDQQDQMQLARRLDEIELRVFWDKLMAARGLRAAG